MAQGGFLQALEQFATDSITEEIVELMEPYFTAPDYSMDQARKVNTLVMFK